MHVHRCDKCGRLARCEDPSCMLDPNAPVSPHTQGYPRECHLCMGLHDMIDGINAKDE